MSGRLACGCPASYPDWRGDVDLGGQLVHDLGIPMFIHMPIGYENYLLKQKNSIERLELHEKWPGFNLTRTGVFRGQMICPLQEEHSPAHNIRILASPFKLRVHLFHGDIADIRQDIRAMQSKLLDEGLLPKELYLSYLTCPECEEGRGGKRLMILRHWVTSKKLAKKLQRRQQKAA
ncbi:MAG: hypothetical protein COA61_002955 [Zetaproteobacteria bacterium]|nr:hypothetical protein [Zetaproteobacteria bacterium]